MKKVYLYICLLLIAYQSKAQTCSCGACTGSIGSMNISNDNAVTLGKGKWMAELNGQYIRFTMPGMMQPDVAAMTSNIELQDAYAVTTGLRYGVSDKLTLTVILPYLSIRAAEHDWSSSGLSDLMLLGDFHVCGDGVETVKFSFLAGIKLPTGDQHPYEQDLPIALSTGSYDPAVGASLVKKEGRVTIRANGFYRYSNKGFNDICFGNFFSHSLLVSFQPGESCDMEDTLQKSNMNRPQLVLYGGFVGENVSPQMSGHSSVINTGSYYLYAKAGIVLNLAMCWSMPVAFEVPVYKSVIGMQNEINYRISTGLSYKF